MKKISSIVLLSIVAFAGCERKQDNPAAQEVNRILNAEEQWAKTWPTLNFPVAKKFPSTVKREYDKFDKETKFQTDWFDLGHCSIMFYMTAAGDAQFLSTPPRTVAIFDYENRIYDMRFLVGGQVLNIRKQSRGIWEIDTVDLLKIATAQQVEVKANEMQFVMTKAQQKMFYDFASVLKH